MRCQNLLLSVQVNRGFIVFPNFKSDIPRLRVQELACYDIGGVAPEAYGVEIFE